MNNSNVKFYAGVMGSGKSARLIRKFLHDLNPCFAFVVCIKGSNLVNSIESRNGSKIPAFGVHQDKGMELTDRIIMAIINKAKSIYIDEIQFLDKRTTQTILRIARKNQNVNFYLYGLSKDFRTNYFESSLELILQLPLKNIKIFESECEVDGCCNNAVYNARLKNGKVVREGELYIEEKAEYKSMCEICYVQK